MVRRIIRIIGICDDEWSRLLSMSNLIFLLMIGWAFGSSAGDSFFIKEAGPLNLPFAYIFKACLEIAVAAVYSRLVDRIARFRFFIMLLCGCGAVLLAVRILIPFKFVWMPFAVFSLSDVITTIIFIHFWTYANDIFDPREGKRIFPLIGGMGLVGAVLGGALINPIVTAIGTVNLLVTWAGILFFSIPLIAWTNKTALSSGFIAKQDFDNENESGGFFNNFTYCWNIPLIRTLAYISIPLCWVYYILDYQFFIALNEVFQEQDRLTAFLGIFNSVVSLNGLIVQLFITGMILRKIGVGSSVLFHPIGVVLGSIALTIRNFLPVSPSPKLFSYRGLSAVFAKYSDVAIGYSIGESASHLLYNSIPEEKRGRSRAFISGTMEPIGTLTASSLLILFTIINVSQQMIALITVGLSVVWVVLSIRLKKEYIRELVENLSSNDLSLRTSAMSELSKMKDSNTIEVLLEAVTSKSEEVSLFALEILKGIKDDKIVTELSKILTIKNPKVQTGILSLLSEIEAKHAVQAVRPLLHDSEPEVQAAAVRVLEKLDGTEDLVLLDDLLERGALAVRVEVIIMYIRRQPDLDRTVRAVEILKELAKNKQESAARAKAAYIIGELRVTQLRYILIDLATTPDDTVQPEAIKSLGVVGDEKIIPLLLQLLPNGSLEETIKDALIKLGNTYLEILHDELRSEKHTKKIKADIIYCLGKIGNPASIPVLEKYIGESPAFIEDGVVESLGVIKENILQKLTENNQEGIKRYFKECILKKLSGYLSATVQQLRKVHIYSSCLKNLHNEKATLLLIDALNLVSQRKEVMALRCLELLTNPKTIHAAAFNLRSAAHRVRAEALEVLEGSCPEAKELVKVLEAKYSSANGKAFSLSTPEIIRDLLMDNEQTWSQVCAIYAIGELHVSELKSELYALQESNDTFIKNNVVITSRKIGIELPDNFNREEVEKMAINMERMLFLRTIPLFKDVVGSDLQWINEITKEKQCSADEIIFKENDEGDALYIIMSGTVRIVKGENNKMTLAILQERDCFGEMAVLDREPRSASAEVQKDARLLVINREDFQRLLLARPQIAFSLFKSLSRRLREMDTRLLEFHKN